MATAGEAEDERAARATIERPLRAAIGEGIKAGALNPWCALCHSRVDTWRYEIGRTAFRSMEEAGPKLRQLEAAQAAVNAIWGDMKRSD